MSDPSNTSPRTPQSSSAWGPSGTSARSVTVEKPSAQPENVPSEGAPEAQQCEVAVEAASEISAPFDEMTANVEPIPFAAGDADPAAHAPAAYEAVQPAVDETAHVMAEVAEKAAAAGEEAQDRAATLFEQVSQSVKLALSDAGSDAALITFTLLEFAQASARNNYQLAQDYAGARSVPDVVNVQAAYFRRQMELMNRQAGELRKVTSEIASKKAALIQARAVR